jgi:hypothetical protein
MSKFTIRGQRVVIYPKEVSQLEAVLSAGEPNIDNADGHPIAYNAILQTCQLYENPPVFLSEEKARTVDDPFIAENVTEWMAATKQVATGSRRRVLENGEDTMDSGDEDDPNMMPDEEKGMYPAEMDPKLGPAKLSRTQAARQRAVAQARKEQMILSAPRVELPSPTGSSDSSAWAVRGLKDESATRLRAVAEPFTLVPVSKAAASQRAPADPHPMVDYHPMVTRSSEASRAGSLRGVVGSGSNGDRCVAQGNPSSKPGS